MKFIQRHMSQANQRRKANQRPLNYVNVNVNVIVCLKRERSQT